jgi:motility quorum-sensing regulator/GCU-specific mRNA interferase toxin
MEKSTPHCKLSVIQTMIKAGQIRTTKTAREGAAALGFGFDEMISIVMA